MEGTIVAIWIKRAHRLPLDSVDRAELVEGRGLAGSADQGGWRQITVIDEAAWKDAEQELRTKVDPSARRANVMIRGLDLENSRGKQLRLGDCVINIRGENPPCRLMDTSQPGLQKALRPHWRAGVFGEIVQGGTIRIGDKVAFDQL
ncbi:MAG TPA: MOSC domain-containing protein [Thermoanaerobaculia bacterium]|jgi:MOSC domain-containing protein YiiM